MYRPFIFKEIHLQYANVVFFPLENKPASFEDAHLSHYMFLFVYLLCTLVKSLPKPFPSPSFSQDTPAVNGFTFPYGKVLSAYVSSIEPFIPDYLTLSSQPETKLKGQIDLTSPIRKSSPLASQISPLTLVAFIFPVH